MGCPPRSAPSPSLSPCASLALAIAVLLAAGHPAEGSAERRERQAAPGGCPLPEQPARGRYVLGGCDPPDCQLQPGDRVPDFAVLTYSCDPGATLSGSAIVYCDGQWSPLPTCAAQNVETTCTPLSSSSHEIQCSLNNTSVSCDEPARPQTKATVKCKQFYEASPDIENYEITCDSGLWTQPLFSCTPECGVYNFNISKESENGVASNLPWYAAIMKKDASGSWKFACSASIVSPRVLVSVAQCVWKEIDKKIVNANNFGVVIGKYEYGPKEVLTNNSQLILVENIYVTDTFRGYERRYEEDISVFVLKDEIIMNEVTRPICIDFDDKYAPYFVPGKDGIVGSWGEPVDETYKQRIISLPIVDFEECLKSIPTEFHSYLTYDKFCAGVLKRQTVCKGDYGVGYANKFKNNKWYLTGIYSVGVSPTDNKSCETDYYKGFTRVSLFSNFIKKYITAGTNNTEVEKPPLFSCKENEFKCATSECVELSRLCNGRKDCSDGSDEKFEECNLKKCAATSFQCRYGACIDKNLECNGRPDCDDGSDEEPTLCKKEVNANPISCTYPPSSNCRLPKQPENGFYTFIGCKSNNQHVPGSIVPAGVLLNFTCNPGFVLSGPSLLACYDNWSTLPPSCNPVLCEPLKNPTRDVLRCILGTEDVDCTTKLVKPGTRATVRCQSNYETIPGLREYDLICESNGKWNRELHSCVPKCGIPNARGVQLISLGRQSLVAEFPWHVGFYEEDQGKIIPSCGGTIVSPLVVISAGHCFYRAGVKTYKQYENGVVAGKYYYDWKNKTKYVQHLQIKDVILHSSFRGEARNYENDIAVVILKYRISINEAVRPVCVDYERNYYNYFSPVGVIGNVTGWGMNEKGSFSETLNVANLPYVDIKECERHTPHQFHVLLTNDKFCAGNLNKTSVCPGDSGGGYTVRFKDHRSYLVGIVSAGPSDIPCGQLTFITFTNVYHHLELIKRYVYKYV